MFTTDLVNLYNRNIFKTSLYIYIFQDEKSRIMRILSLSKQGNFKGQLGKFQGTNRVILRDKQDNFKGQIG